MKIFIDIDDTMLQTSNTCKGNLTGQWLTAERTAPFFEGMEETLHYFKRKGFDCFVVTERGRISEEEVFAVKDRFAVEKEARSCLHSCVYNATNKLRAIEKVYNEVFGSQIDKENTIIIDNDVEQVINCAAHGIQTILFAPESKEEKGNGNTISLLNITVAKSWDDVKAAVLNKSISAKMDR